MKMIRFFSLILLLALAGVSCQKEKKENHPPKILRIKFSPSPPLPGNDLRAVVETQDPDGDMIRVKYRWYVDGELVQKGKSPVLAGEELTEGAEIFVEVQANDGINFTDWVRSETVEVKSLGGLIIDVRIEPMKAFNDSVLKAVVDCPGCGDMIFHYQWLINGEPWEDYDAPELDGAVAELKPNDQVQVKVSPEGSPGEVHISPTVVIANRAPIFLDQGRAWIEGGIFYFKFRAQDPDREKLSYQLVKAPPGASLNPRTETVSWTIPEGFEGTIHLEVKVSDPSGEESTISVSTEIKGGKAF